MTSTVNGSSFAFGSASKRSIIRSPLELLADEQTPPPKGAPAAGGSSNAFVSPSRKQQPQTPSVVHVTHTTTNAREAKPFAAGRYKDDSPDAARGSEHEGRRADGLSPTSSMPPPVRGDEPSALLFMSPAGARVREERPRASDRGHRDDDVSASKSRTHSSGSRTDSTSRRSKSKRKSGSYPADRSVDDDDEDNWMTRSEAKQAVREALESYEQKRDEEEGRVLEEIRAEVATVHAAKERAATEAMQFKAIAEENEGLVAKLQAQCTMLAATTESIHEELQQERQRLQRLEIEACHANDGRRAALADAHKDLEFERGQWNAMKEELEDQLARLKETYRQDMEQLRFNAHEQNTRATELEAQLREVTKACGHHEEAHQRLSAANAGLQAELVTARKELAEKSVSLSAVSKRSQSLEKGDATRRDELSSLQRKVTTLEETTRTQNDDIRKKLFRIQVLEGEVQKAVDATKALGQEYDVAVEKAMLVHASVDSLFCTLRAGVKKHVTSSLSKVRHADVRDSDEEDDSDMSVITRLNDVLTPSGDDEDDGDSNDLDQAAANRGPVAVVNRNHIELQRGSSRGNGITAPQRTASESRGRRSISTATSHVRPRSVSGSRKDPRRTSETAATDGLVLHHHVKKSIPNTLHLLTRAHERTHTLLRKLHVKDAAAIGELEDARRQVQKLTKEIAAVNEAKGDMLRERDELRNASTKLKQRIAAAEELSTVRSNEVVALAQEHRDAQAKAAHFEERYRRVDYELNELRADCTAKQQTVQMLERKCLQHQEEAQRLMALSQEAAPKHEQLHKELLAKERALEEADILVAKHAREVADVAQHKERLQKQVAKLHAELAHVRSEWAKAQDDNMGLQARVAKLDSALLLARKTANRASASNVAAANDRRLDDMQSVVDGLKAQLRDAQGDAHAVAALKDKELEESNKKLQTYRTRLSMVLQQNEAMHQKVREDLCRIASLVRDKTTRIATTTANAATASTAGDAHVRSSSMVDGAVGSPPGVALDAQSVPRGVAARGVDPFTPQQAVRASSPMRGAVASGGAMSSSPLTPSATSATLSEAVLLVETSVTDALHAWDFHSHQRTLQLHALEQTVSFLELELRCQASQQRQQRSHHKATANALVHASPQVASPQHQSVVVPLSFASPPPAPVAGARCDYPQHHAERQYHSEANDDAARLQPPAVMFRQSSLSPANAALLLEPPSALDALHTSAANRWSHAGLPPSAVSPPSPQRPSTNNAGSPGARPPPHAEPVALCTAPTKPMLPGAASRSHSASSDDVRSSMGGVGGSASSSRSVDGLSASPMRPPSLRSVPTVRVH